MSAPVSREEAEDFCRRLNELKRLSHAAYSSACGGEPDDEEEPDLRVEDVQVTFTPADGRWTARDPEGAQSAPSYLGRGATARDALEAALEAEQAVLERWRTP